MMAPYTRTEKAFAEKKISRECHTCLLIQTRVGVEGWRGGGRTSQVVLVCLREIRGLRNKREARRYFADSAQAAGTDVLPMKHDVI